MLTPVPPDAPHAARPADPDDALVHDLRAALRDVPDHPRPGILFRDITPILAEPALFARVTAAMAAPFADQGVTHVAAVESRGFIFGAPVAHALGAGFVPLRKPGKLPYDRHRVEYALEYGVDALEAHVDACATGNGRPARVLVVDDVLATGGTAGAACELVEGVGGVVVGCAFLLELGSLDGRLRLGDRLARALVTL